MKGGEKVPNVDNFECKACKANYCNQWLRACVGWENCNLNSYGAPCPGCVSSSPLDAQPCQKCKHFPWKQANYQP